MYQCILMKVFGRSASYSSAVPFYNMPSASLRSGKHGATTQPEAEDRQKPWQLSEPESKRNKGSSVWGQQELHVLAQKEESFSLPLIFVYHSDPRWIRWCSTTLSEWSFSVYWFIFQHFGGGNTLPSATKNDVLPETWIILDSF